VKNYIAFLLILFSTLSYGYNLRHYESREQCITNETIDTFLGNYINAYGSEAFLNAYGRYDVSLMENVPAKAALAEKQLKLAMDFFSQVFNWNVIGGNETLLLLSNLNDGDCQGLNAFYAPLSSGAHVIGVYNLHPSSPITMANDLDVLAHEYGHGFFRYHQPNTSTDIDGLNESVADMFGITARAWHESGKQMDNLAIRADSYIVGSSVGQMGQRFYGMDYPYIRNMQNPSESGHADYYPDVTNTQREEVHSFAGVTNLAFYLMSKGGRHPRVNNGINVAGLGLKKSIGLIHYALKNRFPFNTMPEFGDAVRKAATRIYGRRSGEFQSVDRAFNAVGLESNLPAPPQPEPAQPEPEQPETVQSEPVQSEPAPVQPESEKPISISGPTFIIALIVILLGTVFIVSILASRQKKNPYAPHDGATPARNLHSTQDTAWQDTVRQDNARQDTVRQEHYRPKPHSETSISLGIKAIVKLHGQQYPLTLDASPVIIGRGSDLDLPNALKQALATDDYLSRKHCSIWYKASTKELYVHSLSSNGGRLQNYKIEGESKVKIDFDRPITLVVGKTTLVIEPAP
jgi:hypothetical protein